jgi:energy-converting hydrogenase Eha subunit E
MRNILLIIVGIIDVLANVPYIIDSLRGKTRPNMATWSTWSLINLIIVVAALAAGGAINTVVLGLTYFAGSFSILIIGIFRGTRKYTKFDVICQAIALMGVVLWQLQGNPNLALITVIIVGEIAALPTIRHAYRYPEEETWLTFAIC